MDRSKISETGFTVVFEPERLSSDPPLVDIVFIHGLQGHPYRTWTYMASEIQSDIIPPGSNVDSATSKKRSIGRTIVGLVTHLKKPRQDKAHIEAALSEDGRAIQEPESLRKDSNTIFWPADLLPQDCPKARILVWGYDTRISGPLGEAVSKNTIFNHGKDLLFGFRRERNLDVPIIFVAHSLGGIILKEALTESYHSGELDLENVAKSTKAVVFLGTPHRGSKDMAGVGEIARRVASTFMVDTSRTMLDSLGLKNSDLERCQHSFTRIWQKIDFNIKTFQEGLPFAGVNLGLLNEKVVPDLSSLLGDPREHAETLQANHMDMCRFRGEYDPNYRKVGGELRSLYGSIMQALSAPKSGSQAFTEWSKRSVLREDSDKFLQYYRDARAKLYFPELGQRQHVIEIALKDTCQRVLKSERYETWFSRQNLDQHQGLLWIKGKPGSGKSTFMKEAIRHASISKSSHSHHVIGFFFNARGNELEKTTVGFYRAVLYQLLPVFRERMQDFIKFCNLKPSKEDEVTWDAQALKNQLRTILSEFSGIRISIFVDALDECMGDGPRDTIQFLRELSADAASAGAMLNICMSSRHYPTITIANYLELVFEDHNAADIALFVEKKLSMAVNGYSSGNDHYWVRIKNEVIKRASGIFLWAKVVLDLLIQDYDNGKGINSLESRLLSVPPALGDLYLQILQEISPDERNEAACFFSWVLLAIRPIQLREWYQLLAFVGDSPPRSLDEWKRSENAVDNDDQLQRQIRRLSRGLVEIQRGEAQGKIMNDEQDSIRATPGSFYGEGFGTLQFIHESVREFFLNSNGFEPFYHNTPPSALGEAHLSIVKTCFDYLAVRELDPLVHGRMNAPSATSDTSSGYSGPEHFNERPHGLSTSRQRVPFRRQGSNASMRSFASARSAVGGSASNYAHSIASMHYFPDIRAPSEQYQFHTESLSKCNHPAGPSISAPVSEIGNDEIRPSDIATSGTPFSPHRAMSDSFPVSIPLARFLDWSAECVSAPEDPLEVDSIASSLENQRKILEEIPCLLYVVSEMIIPHAISAEREGCNPSRLIKHLQDGPYWSRWVHLRDKMSRDTTLLYFAAEHGLLSWASSLLVAGTDINRRGGKLGHPLFATAPKGNAEVLHLLLRNGVNINTRDPKSRTIIHYLAATPNHAFLRAILEEYHRPNAPIDIDAVDCYDLTPLQLAVRLSCHMTVKELVEHGAKIDHHDAWDNNPLHFASSRPAEDSDIIRYLLSRGACGHHINRLGMTPLDVALMKGFHKSATLIREHQSLYCHSDINRKAEEILA